MMTVKIEMQRFTKGKDPICRITTEIIEATHVEIACLRPGFLFEICGKNANNDPFSYYIANPNGSVPEGFASDVEFGSAAYIENAQGSTIHMVRFDMGIKETRDSL
jgi:hypothetical protein